MFVCILRGSHTAADPFFPLVPYTVCLSHSQSPNYYFLGLVHIAYLNFLSGSLLRDVVAVTIIITRIRNSRAGGVTDIAASQDRHCATHPHIQKDTLYKILASGDATKIFTSTAAILAAGRCMRDVKELKLRWGEVMYYYNWVYSLQDFQDFQARALDAPSI